MASCLVSASRPSDYMFIARGLWRARTTVNRENRQKEWSQRDLDSTPFILVCFCFRRHLLPLPLISVLQGYVVSLLTIYHVPGTSLHMTLVPSVCLVIKSGNINLHEVVHRYRQIEY